jgi:hypothetical protein
MPRCSEQCRAQVVTALNATAALAAACRSTGSGVGRSASGIFGAGSSSTGAARCPARTAYRASLATVVSTSPARPTTSPSAVMTFPAQRWQQ